MSTTADIYNTLTDSSFCSDDYYDRNQSMTPGFLTGYIIFHILNFLVLAMVFCALLVHPFSKSKIRSCLSFCDIRTNWKWKKGDKKGWNGEPTRELKANEPKSMAGSVITVYTIWIMFGVFLYLTDYFASNRQILITESQDKLSIQNMQNLFNMAAVIKVSMNNNQVDCSNVVSLSSFSVTGQAVRAVSAIKTKSEASGYRRYCYIWIESTIDPSLLPSSVNINISKNSFKYGHYRATFGLLSSPWNSQDALSSQRKFVVNYLKSRATYCARIDTTRGYSVTVGSEPKSFQYPDPYGFRDSDLSFSNLLHFPSQFNTVPSSSAEKINFQVNIDSQKAFLLQPQPILNIVMMYVVIIAATIILVPWIRTIALLFISNYLRSFVWRIIILGLLSLVVVGFFTLFGVKLKLLFGDITSPSIVLTGVIHSTIYFLALMLNMVVFHKRYKQHQDALNAGTALPVDGGETSILLPTQPSFNPIYQESDSQHVISYQSNQNIIYPLPIQQTGIVNHQNPQYHKT